MRAHAVTMTRPPLLDGLDIGFTGELRRWRAQGRQRWADCRTANPAAELDVTMPNYLLDRYAFRCAMENRFGVEIRDQFTEPPSARVWLTRTRRKLRGADDGRISAVDLDALAPDTARLRDLLGRWREHLVGIGVTLSPEAFGPLSGWTWLRIYRSSVLVPFYPPAILGPSFVDRVSEAQRRSLLLRYGTAGIWDLYTFLLRSHEETHREQRGEPMLCEFLLAALWCAFLDRHDQWHWQRNDSSGASLNLEEPYVRQLDLAADIISRAFHDTAGGITALAGAATYDELCLCAWLFDARAIDYRRYLDLVTRCLCDIPIVDDVRATLGDLDRVLLTEQHETPD
ncbi:hypothetical protein ACFQ1S_02480 [Kibdelosporangium lantanae]|uniref:Uncharacterized protein n=1 Tax=Kibdelosporangium lantanae TaxID=1497396 RepID=A0ABW3M1I5_9PSEU